jgi:hypothetical protein
MEYRLAKTNEEAGYKIIKTFEEDGKMFAECRRPCERCGGKGEIPYYGHIDRGVCFKCGGAKYFYKTFRAYTEVERLKLDEQNEKRKQKKDEALKAESEKNLKEWKEKYGFSDEIFIVAGCNTYAIKDMLKEAGARFYSGLNWFFTEKNLPENLELPEGAFFYNTSFDTVFEWEYSSKRCYLKTGALDIIAEEIKEIVKNKNQATSRSQHYGEIGERIRKAKAIYKGVKCITTDWGSSMLYTFEIDGNIFTWFTQSLIPDGIQPEDEIELSGTIKAHTEFQGILQTQLSRCIVKEVK